MAVLVTRIVLVGMFGVSALAKLADRRGMRQAVDELGAPPGWVGPLSMMLVGLELGIAVALLVGSSFVAAGGAAVALLTGLSLVVGWNILRGRRPECHCFGRLSSGPVGWSTVARNGFFGALAALVAFDGRFAGYVAIVAAAAFAFWVGPGVRRRWVQRDGAAATAFSLLDASGETWTLDRLLASRRPLVLVFSQPACGGCDLLMPDVAKWQSDRQRDVTVVVVSGGSSGESAAKARQYQLRQVLVDSRRELIRAYGITATPSAVLIRADRTIVEGPALGAGEIEHLVERAATVHDEPSITRRGVLERAVLGLASATFVPVVAAVASACGSSSSSTAASKKEVEVDGAWLCDQPYALCTTAPCQPSPTDPNVAVCRCLILNGYSMGYRSCSDRKPSGNQLVSTFSTQNVNPSFAVMNCPSQARWANCVDVTCQIDSTNPGQAVCNCPIVATGPSFTFGGGCQTSTCTSVIWSGAKPPGVSQFPAAMKKVNQPVVFPKNCPT